MVTQLIGSVIFVFVVALLTALWLGKRAAKYRKDHFADHLDSLGRPENYDKRFIWKNDDEN